MSGIPQGLDLIPGCEKHAASLEKNFLVIQIHSEKTELKHELNPHGRTEKETQYFILLKQCK